MIYANSCCMVLYVCLFVLEFCNHVDVVRFGVVRNICNFQKSCVFKEVDASNLHFDDVEPCAGLEVYGPICQNIYHASLCISHNAIGGMERLF